MKGIVFTEFVEMVENELGLEVADQMFENAETQNSGAYTSVGTYDHTDLIALVVSLSQATSTPVPDLVKAFGKYLFDRLSQLYPQFFEGIDSALDFLPLVEQHIHVEVQKLYPDAELPTFACETIEGNQFQMTYRSNRPFADLAEGMIGACVAHFEDSLQVAREDLGARDGSEARFILSPAHVELPVHEQEVCPN